MTSTGILLMTYGSATTNAGVQAYLDHVYKDFGKPAPNELVDEFARRYDLVGDSPLIELTEVQAKTLETMLNSRTTDLSTASPTLGSLTPQYTVWIGMQHSAPFILDGVRELKERGAERILGIVLSPQYSPLIMGGYGKYFYAATDAAGYSRDDVSIAEPWPTEPHFIQYLSEVLLKKRAEILESHKRCPIIFTTHSLPERVVAKDPSYLEQLKATREAVAASAGLAPHEWTYSYQSAGHAPEPWLAPDIPDVLAELRDHNETAVLIVPIQFLTDHLEILYDLDVAGREQCEEYGISYHRTPMPNTHPLFIHSLASIAQKNQSIF